LSLNCQTFLSGTSHRTSKLPCPALFCWYYLLSKKFEVWWNIRFKLVWHFKSNKIKNFQINFVWYELSNLLESNIPSHIKLTYCFFYWNCVCTERQTDQFFFPFFSRLSVKERVLKLRPALCHLAVIIIFWYIGNWLINVIPIHILPNLIWP